MGSRDNLKIINPASGAIIMALGIFLYATIDAFPILSYVWGKIFTVVLLIIGIVIYKSIIRQFFYRDFLIPYFNNPVNSFAMGTWIAGASVLCNVFMKYFPGLSAGVLVLAGVNSLLFLPFLVSCTYNFKQLSKRPTKHSTHGVVLLSTVATQSLVIVWVEMFPSLSNAFVISTVSLGLIFYLYGVVLIGIRYGNEKKWSLAKDWTNTNCIIHGALSITGLAIVSSEVMSAVFIMIFWLVVFALLVIIETLEITRAVQRVRQFGWRKGIFTYNISQWSRNFTFGMFYAFTMTMHESPYYMNAMYDFHGDFMSVWAWIVLVTLLVEIGLWLESRRNLFERSTKKHAL